MESRLAADVQPHRCRSARLDSEFAVDSEWARSLQTQSACFRDGSNGLGSCLWGFCRPATARSPATRWFVPLPMWLCRLEASTRLRTTRIPRFSFRFRQPGKSCANVASIFSMAQERRRMPSGMKAGRNCRCRPSKGRDPSACGRWNGIGPGSRSTRVRKAERSVSRRGRAPGVS